MLLALDCVKRVGICKNGGSVGCKLKSVHWVLMLLGWWWREGHNNDTQLIHELLYYALCFFMKFSWSEYSLHPLTRQPMRVRPVDESSPAPIWLGIPSQPGKNLAHHVTEGQLQSIRDKLGEMVRSLTSEPVVFYRDACSRWEDWGSRISA